MNLLTPENPAPQIQARASAILISLAFIGSLTSCGKTEKIPTTAERLSAIQQKQETQPDFYLPRKTVDYMTDLKSLKDAPAKPEPAQPREIARPAEKRPDAPESRTITAPAPVTPAAQTLPASQPTVTSVPAASVVASATPSARPAPKPEPAPSIIVIGREQPAFPRDALRDGIEGGTVRARMTINAAGEVTNVAILQAQPPRVFDRSVQLALGRWKFNPGAEGRTFDTEIAFKAAN